MRFHGNGDGVCILVYFSLQHVLGSFGNGFNDCAVFLCQVFIPAIYKNSTDIQLAESISPRDPQYLLIGLVWRSVGCSIELLVMSHETAMKQQSL